ncbi:hypothetical protein Tco_0696699 [Tanacetum coccineum]
MGFGMVPVPVSGFGMVGLGKLLSPLMELISYQPTSPFVELRSLKAYPRGLYSIVQETIPNEVKKYFLDSSPSATFTMVSCEEMRALENATSAQMLMAKLWAMLEHEKEKIKEIDSYWKDLSGHIEHGKEKTYGITSKLLDIKPLLTKLPASKRPHIEASYYSLCVKAKSVMNEIMDCMKIQFDKEQSRLRSTFMNLL